MKTEKTQNVEKTKIYNLVILDASGSMSVISNAVISGFNEVLSGAQKAAKDFADSQEHYMSFVSFNTKVKMIYDRKSPNDIKPITHREYQTNGCTALYDAMGSSLTGLEKIVDAEDDAVGVVTIITDGYENASHNYSLEEVVAIIDRLKEKGWTFAFMGANQDVARTTASLHINNSIKFEFNDTGMRECWERDRMARERYYCRMRDSRDDTMNMSRDERRRYYRDEELAHGYFDEGASECNNNRRVSPHRIVSLNPSEIFVFGSNIDGVHGGGASALAYKRFGAVWGQGEGLQGSSYAIPTNDGVVIMMEAVKRFIEFAKAHPELKFYVTAIGCGVSGYMPEQVAALFKDAVSLENVYLPQEFLNFL